MKHTWCEPSMQPLSCSRLLFTLTPLFPSPLPWNLLGRAFPHLDPLDPHPRWPLGSLPSSPRYPVGSPPHRPTKIPCNSRPSLQIVPNSPITRSSIRQVSFWGSRWARLSSTLTYAHPLAQRTPRAHWHTCSSKPPARSLLAYQPTTMRRITARKSIRTQKITLVACPRAPQSSSNRLIERRISRGHSPPLRARTW